MFKCKNTGGAAVSLCLLSFFDFGLVRLGLKKGKAGVTQSQCVGRISGLTGQSLSFDGVISVE